MRAASASIFDLSETGHDINAAALARGETQSLPQHVADPPVRHGATVFGVMAGIKSVGDVADGTFAPLAAENASTTEARTAPSTVSRRSEKYVSRSLVLALLVFRGALPVVH